MYNVHGMQSNTIIVNRQLNNIYVLETKKKYYIMFLTHWYTCKRNAYRNNISSVNLISVFKLSSKINYRTIERFQLMSKIPVK